MPRNKFTYWNEIWETNVNVAENTSIIHCNVHLKANGRGWISSDTAGNRFYGYITIDGVESGKKLLTDPNWAEGSHEDRVIMSYSRTITHSGDGSLAIGVSSRFYSDGYYSPGNCSDSDTFYGYKIPRKANLNSAPDFNDEESPTIKYDNPAGWNVSDLDTCISWTGADDITYRPIDKGGSSYTYNFTDEEKVKLQKACLNSNSRTVTFYVRTIIGENYYYSTVNRTLSIVNANPVFGEITYQDTNKKVTDITDNNQVIVRNVSNLVFDVKAATLKKSATVKEYKILLNGIEKTFTSPGKIDFGALNTAESLEAICTIIDSRGNSNTVKKKVTVENWKLPTALIDIKRKENFYSQTSILVDATFSPVLNKNILDIKFQYKKANEEVYSDLLTLEDNKEKIIDLDNNFAWDIKIYLTDKFGKKTYNAFLDRGIPIIYIDVLNKSFGINGFPKFKNSIESNGVRLDNIYIGNQVIYDHYNGSNSTTLLSALNYSLLDGLFTEIPRGYVKAYKITAQVQTDNKNAVSVEINNIATNSISSTYRNIITSQIFKESDILLEKVGDGTGINLKVNNSENYGFNIYNIIVHAYLVKE